MPRPEAVSYTHLTQHDEPLAIRDDGVGLARGARLADLHASAKVGRGGRKECLAGASGDLGSDPAPFEFADLRCAVRVLGLDAEPAEHFAALGNRTLHLGSQPVGGQAVRPDPVEPNRPRTTNLLPERERLLAQKDAVTNGPAAVLRGEVLEQGGRDPPALRRLPGDEAESLEFEMCIRDRSSSFGTAISWSTAVLVLSMTMSPRAFDWRTSRMPSRQPMSGVAPLRRSGRREDGRRPVAKPVYVIAKYCGYLACMHARKSRSSATVSEFGSSRV